MFLADMIARVINTPRGFARRDARFDTGLEIVGHDHRVRDLPLGCLAAGTWRGQTWIRIDPLAAHGRAGSMHDLSRSLETLLDQHLVDEKHPAIPIIIH